MVFVTAKSAHLLGVIVQLTVLLVPCGPKMVRLFVKFPTAFARTLTFIIALDFAAMPVMFQVITCPLTTSPIIFAPVMPTVSMNSKPSGKLSITVKLFV